MTIPALPVMPDVARRLSGRPILLLLDVDGTLAPIAPRPEYAIVPLATQRVLQELVRLPDLFIAVISGRAAADAAQLVGVEGTWTLGNHGLEIAPPGEAPMARPDVLRFATTIASAAERCRVVASKDPGVIVEDKRWSLSVHYRLAHPRIVPELVAEVTAIAHELGLRVTQGKDVVEVRPPIDVNKGTAAVELAKRMGALALGASIFFGGDDRTDEDAFLLLRSACADAVTVQVGEESTTFQTAAEFRVRDTDAFRTLLESILELRKTDPPLAALASG
jgi:trehalose-phosphatase